MDLFWTLLIIYILYRFLKGLTKPRRKRRRKPRKPDHRSGMRKHRPYVKKRSRGWCEICGKKPGTDLDHIIPVSLLIEHYGHMPKAGNEPNNLQYSCARCNRVLKRDDHPLDFGYGWAPNRKYHQGYLR